MSIKSTLVQVFYPKSHIDTGAQQPPVPASKLPANDQFVSESQPSRKRATYTPLMLARPKRGEAVGQGCFISEKCICLPLCGTCINPDPGPKGLFCFCIPLCFSH